MEYLVIKSHRDLYCTYARRYYYDFRTERSHEEKKNDWFYIYAFISRDPRAEYYNINTPSATTKLHVAHI